MSPELYALGLRARAAKRFRWVEGMAAGSPGWLDDARILEVDYTKPGRPPTVWWYRGRTNSVDNGDEWDEGAVPALDDDATLGCLLAQEHPPDRSQTEGLEDLVVALEAAP